MKRALGVAILMAGLFGHRSVVVARSGNTPEVTLGHLVTNEDSGAPPAGEAEWAVLDGCVDDPPRPPDGVRDFAEFSSRLAVCADAARTVAGGNAADRDRLWSVFDTLSEDSDLTGGILDAFLDRDVERALVALEAASKPAALDTVVGEEMPVFLRDGPDELQQAWHLYQSVTALQEKTFDRPALGAAIGFQANGPAFRRTVAAFLRGRISAAEAISQVSRYQWGGWCGTGSGALYVPQGKTLLLAYLRLGRVDLALASAGVLHGGFMGVKGAAVGSDPRLLAAAGIDWERYHLGGVLSGRFDLAVALVLHGSEQTARWLLAAARTFDALGQEVPEIVSEGLSWPLAALVEPGENSADPGAWSSREVGPRAKDAEPIQADIQEGVLDLLANRVGPAAGRREAETASHLLVKLGRTESRDAFRAMLGSHYEDVRANGARGLRLLGETTADPLPSRPVLFRLVVNGKPAADRTVHLRLGNANGGSEMTEAQTDGDGFVRVGRDSFVDPRDPVSSVWIQSPDLKAAADHWFEVEVAPPHDLDAVTTVSVRTGALSVVIPPELLDGEGELPTIELFAAGDAATSRTGEIPASSTRIAFSHLQHGRYAVWLRRGATMYLSPEVEVGDQPATTAFGLEPAYSPDVEEPEERAANPTNQPL